MNTPDIILQTANQIVQLTRPLKIYLYNIKTGVSSQITAFKLCLILDSTEKLEAEHDIYMKIDCDIPFDILIYTPQEWAVLSADLQSFAHKIEQTGRVLYEKAGS